MPWPSSSTNPLFVGTPPAVLGDLRAHYMVFCFGSGVPPPQVGFEQHWLEFIRSYVVPVQIKVYPGYYSKVSVAAVDNSSSTQYN